MIILAKPQRHETPSRNVMYTPNEDGKCISKHQIAEFDHLIDEYYVQRELEMERLHKLLLAQRISPVAFFTEYHHMDIKDVAARTGLRTSAVKKHLTPEGFKKIRIDTLQKYARIFDLAVSDFFEFTYLSDDLQADVQRHNDRLLQHVTVKPTEKT